MSRVSRAQQTVTERNRGVLSMTRFLIIALLPAFAAVAQDQPSGFVVATVAYQSTASPAFTGAGIYAKQILPAASPRTYSWTEEDVLPQSWKPFVLASVLRTGIYQQVFQVGSFTTGICGDIGGGIAGASGIGSFGGCGAAFYRIGKTGWHVAGIVSGIKNSSFDATTVYKFGIRRDI